MVPSGTLRRVAPVRTDVSEELSSSFIRVTRIGELGTTLAVTSNYQLCSSTSHHCIAFQKAAIFTRVHSIVTQLHCT
jgi:hypothetical protein